MSAPRDDERSATAVFRISKRAVRVGLPELPQLVYPEAHAALSIAVVSVWDPAVVRLPTAVARDLLHWLKALAYRHAKDQSRHAAALAEAAEDLEFALDRLADRS